LIGLFTVFLAYQWFPAEYWQALIRGGVGWGAPPLVESPLPMALAQIPQTVVVLSYIILLFFGAEGALSISPMLFFALLPGGLSVPIVTLLVPLMHRTPVAVDSSRGVHKVIRGIAFGLLLGASCYLGKVATFFWHGPIRSAVNASNVLPQKVKAYVILKEDYLFYEHHGLDFAAVKWVLMKTLRTGKLDRGASTISMQLAKQRYLSYEKSLIRKFDQLLLGILLDWTLSKDEILREYVERLDFGAGIFGIEHAAESYFDVAAQNLKDNQLRQLILTFENPYAYNPGLEMPSSLDAQEASLIRRIRGCREQCRTLVRW
ncbi:MAG: transglycosylase domain-containing protein, partial [Bdellovibrionales bacterium]|nr:transglycosylase domain-containing protein [Bdellovibrionales bacterium]